MNIRLPIVARGQLAGESLTRVKVDLTINSLNTFHLFSLFKVQRISSGTAQGVLNDSCLYFLSNADLIRFLVFILGAFTPPPQMLEPVMRIPLTKEKIPHNM